jgi:hypothetical protein
MGFPVPFLPPVWFFAILFSPPFLLVGGIVGAVVSSRRGAVRLRPVIGGAAGAVLGECLVFILCDVAYPDRRVAPPFGLIIALMLLAALVGSWVCSRLLTR